MNTMTDCIHGLFLLCPTNDSAPQPCDSLTHILRQPRNPSLGISRFLRQSPLSMSAVSDRILTSTHEACASIIFTFISLLSYHEIPIRAIGI